MLRLRDGEAVVASDGAGSFRACRARRPTPRTFALEADGPLRSTAAPVPQLTVCLSLLKGERTEWAVEKLTEAGVDEIVPLLCERTVVRPGEQGAGRRQRRLALVARQAAMQSRRLFLPRLLDPLDLRAALALGGERAFLAEPGGQSPTLARPFALVGPEGGWSERELALAEREGAPLVALGAGVLRAETAAVAAGLLLSALRVGLFDPARSTGDRSR